MAAVTTALLAAGLAATAVGTAVSYVGQKKQTAALQKAETAREAQMRLNARRERREIVRQGIIAQGVALFRTSAQGAQFGSALPGAQGQIAGQTGRGVVASNQNEALGSSIFAANQDYYSASGITSFGSGLTSLGQSVINNLGPIERLSTLATSRRPVPASTGFY